MTARRAITLVSGQLAEMPAGDSLVGAGGFTDQGRAVLDFGTAGGNEATVTGASAGITAGAIVQAWVCPINDATTGFRDVMDQVMEEVDVKAYASAGVGVVIWGFARNGVAYGKISIAWRY